MVDSLSLWSEWLSVDQWSSLTKLANQLHAFSHFNSSFTITWYIRLYDLDLIQVQQLEILLKQNCFDQKLHFTLFYESIKASPLPKKSKCSQTLRSTVRYRLTPLQLLSSPVVCLTDEIRTWQFLSKLNAMWKKTWKRLSEVNWRSYLLKWHKRHTQHWSDSKEIGSEK